MTQLHLDTSSQVISFYRPIIHGWNLATKWYFLNKNQQKSTAIRRNNTVKQIKHQLLSLSNGHMILNLRIDCQFFSELFFINYGSFNLEYCLCNINGHFVNLIFIMLSILANTLGSKYHLKDLLSFIG